jgi:dihydrofolate reductase
MFGRKTYEIFEQFWPHQVVDESGAVPDPHRPERKSREHGTIATALNRMTKVVFSRTLREITWQPSRLMRDVNPADLRDLKRRPGKNIMVFGSGSIVSELTRHGLIDEYQFVACPVLIGRGRNLVEGPSRSLKLKLLETQAYGSGDVMLRYARAE